MKYLKYLVLVASLAMPFSAFAEGIDATLHKNPDCYCCELYGQYLEKNGFNVTVVAADNLATLKQHLGVPTELGACHTTVIGNYAIEGHVPVESINRLLEEQPDVSGIAVPGMPAGSPGMGGKKSGPMVVYSFADSGAAHVYETN